MQHEGSKQAWLYTQDLPNLGGDEVACRISTGVCKVLALAQPWPQRFIARAFGCRCTGFPQCIFAIQIQQSSPIGELPVSKIHLTKLIICLPGHGHGSGCSPERWWWWLSIDTTAIVEVVQRRGAFTVTSVY